MVERLQTRQVERVQGFYVPLLLDYDESLQVLELSFVRPPYILDFAEATLDRPPRGFDPQNPDWIAERLRKYGNRWPDVARLLDALRQYVVRNEFRQQPRLPDGSSESGANRRRLKPELQH